MTNNEKFNQLLNAGQDPRCMYAALLALAESGIFQKLRREWQNGHQTADCGHAGEDHG